MSEHFADRLLAAVQAKGAPVCVGIDPVVEKLPEPLRAAEPVAAIVEFSLAVVEAVAPHVPAVKPNIAYFERYGAAGVAAYERVVAAARAAGLIVIGDVKRGDIGHTAAQYAAAHLGPGASADAITVNGYFGTDGTAPFIDACRAGGKGIFVLVRTSNPSAKEVQDFAHCSGETLFHHLAGLVAAMGGADDLLGRCGLSCVGAVVGATYPDEARDLRRIMPAAVFLVPGYGAQGATARDCLAAFRPDGTGALVNASRSVLYAFADARYAGMDWRKAVAAAARAFADEMAAVLR